MDTTTVCLTIIMLVIDIFLIVRDMRYKLDYKGRSQFKLIVPTVILVFIAMNITSKKLNLSDIILIIAMIPLALCGNKCGINKEGIFSNSYLTTWDKVEEFDIEKVNNKYLLQYKSNIGIRKLYFNSEIGEKVEDILASNRKIRHRRKKK